MSTKNVRFPCHYSCPFKRLERIKGVQRIKGFRYNFFPKTIYCPENSLLYVCLLLLAQGCCSTLYHFPSPEQKQSVFLSDTAYPSTRLRTGLTGFTALDNSKNSHCLYTQRLSMEIVTYNFWKKRIFFHIRFEKPVFKAKKQDLLPRRHEVTRSFNKILII